VSAPDGRGPPQRLVFATRNRGKLRELVRLLQIEGVALLSLEDLPGVPEVEERGMTFAANAITKARAVAQATGLPALADDSGLEVDALGGAPGVHSARYAGAGASDADRIALLLKNLASLPAERRTARFRCAVAFVDPRRPEQPILHEASCEGRILERPRGEGGFGYDPVFHIEELGKTLAEVDPETKNRLSHRGKAMRKMAAELRAILGRR